MRLDRAAIAAVLVGAAACTSAPAVSPSPSVSPSPTASEPAPTPSPPARGEPWTFAVVGDWGAGTHEQSAVLDRMCRVRDRVPFDVVVTPGDNFYDQDGTATEANYYDPADCLIRGGITWRATWGNHDARGDDVAEVLGAKHWYRWRSGPVQFFMLDSNAVNDPEQRAWLAAGLADSTAPLKIAVFHFPPYTVGTVHRDNEDVKREWVPLFEEHGVPLVLTGHNHLYEHQVVRGIHYVVSGGGGRALYGCGDPVPTSRACESVHHFLLVTVRPSRVVVEALDAGGRRVDRFTFDR